MLVTFFCNKEKILLTISKNVFCIETKTYVVCNKKKNVDLVIIETWFYVKNNIFHGILQL